MQCMSHDVSDAVAIGCSHDDDRVIVPRDNQTFCAFPRHRNHRFPERHHHPGCMKDIGHESTTCAR